MGEISSIHFTNTYQPSAAQLNTPARTGAADAMFAIAGASAMPEAVVTSAVYAGLDVSGVVNDMRVLVGAGAGVLLDMAAVAPEGLWQPIFHAVLAGTYSTALSDGDAVDDRIDVICCRYVTDLLDVQAVAKKGGGTDNIATRRGGTFEVLVVEGVPAPAPVAPATPAGYLKLSEVTVPAGMTAGGGGTSACTVMDYREFRGAVRRGPFDAIGEELIRYEAAWTGVRNLVTLAAHETAGAGAASLSWRGDKDAHWPCWGRVAPPAGDQAPDLYPLVNPGGRTWWETIPGDRTRGAEVSTADATVEKIGYDRVANDFVGTRITHLTGNAVTVDLTLAIQAPARGVSITDAYISYFVQTVLGGAGDVRARVRIWEGPADNMSVLSAEVILGNLNQFYDTRLGVGAGALVERTLDEGEIVLVSVQVSFDAVADAAQIDIKAARVQWTEGRNV